MFFITELTSLHSLALGHVTIGLDAMLHAVEFPACIADLDTSLAHVDRDALALGGKRKLDFIFEGLLATLFHVLN